MTASSSATPAISLYDPISPPISAPPPCGRAKSCFRAIVRLFRVQADSAVAFDQIKTSLYVRANDLF
ncbi:hypothetical protein HOC_15102 [Hyphomonas oceanitis SCH89]|uniref:Uncharacterized protein n=1 Tax=Hyphomonas oceanitis SCH89 TaxID=1280953 RepID=A0A059G4V3_9PROT|nr:hypothetical protein HOC_15102 [Hyphomonas oceanitis SCH89]